MTPPATGPSLAQVVALRAPVPVLASLVLTGAFFALVHRDHSPADTLLLWTVPLSGLAAALFGQIVRGSLTALLFALGAGAVAYFHEALLLQPWVFAGAMGVAAFVAPLVGRAADAPEAWRRLMRQVAALGLALLGASVLCLGVLLAEIAVEALFGVGSRRITTDVIVPAAYGFLAPLVFLALSEIAAPGGEDRVSDALGLIGQTFARLVLVPLLAIYAAVLAAYVVRVIASQSLPSGEVGWIVPLFATTGALTFVALASTPGEGRVARAFVRAWFPLTLVPLALFAVALGVRIEAYGITPARYFAILMGVWLGALALAFSLGGSRSDVRLIPVSGALILALGAIGPASMLPIVTKSQTERVQMALATADPGATLRLLSIDERRDVCSRVFVLEDLGQLAPVDASLGLSADEPGLAALCRAPFASADPAMTVRFDDDGGIARLPGGLTLWGPHNLGADARIEASDGSLIVAARDEGLVVTVEGDETAFSFVELANVAEARADGGAQASGRPVLTKGRVSLVLRQIHLEDPGDGPRLRFATVIIAVAPGDAAAPLP